MKKKIVAACLVICLLATAVIGTTLAYFTDTDEVTNTFTAGNVDITLLEHPLNENGKTVDKEAAGVEGQAYHVYPGVEYQKDPYITVSDGSEDCYLFVKLENGLAGLETKKTGKTIVEQMNNKGWEALSEPYGDVFVLTVDGEPVIKSENDEVYVFDTFEIDASKNATDLKGIEDKPVKLTAYAVQADGVADAEAAWIASFGSPVEP